MTNEKRVTIELVRENGEVKEFMAGVLPAVAKQILRTTSPSNGGRLRIVEPTATPVEGVTAAQAVELIDVDALFPVDALPRAAYSCEHTEDVGMPGNCEGCAFCRSTAAAVTAPLVTTRAMALSVLCDDIATAETGVERRRASLSAMVQRGVDQPHDHARLAFDNAAIDIMWHQHATLLGRSMDDRA